MYRHPTYCYAWANMIWRRRRNLTAIRSDECKLLLHIHNSMRELSNMTWRYWGEYKGKALGSFLRNFLTDFVERLDINHTFGDMTANYIKTDLESRKKEGFSIRYNSELRKNHHKRFGISLFCYSICCLEFWRLRKNYEHFSKISKEKQNFRCFRPIKWELC